MAVMISDDEMPDILRGLRLLLVQERKDAAAATGSSYHGQAVEAANRLEGRIAHYEQALKMSRAAK